MRVKDFKLTPYWKRYIKNLGWDLEINETTLLHDCQAPFGTDSWGLSDFPRGHSDYLRRFKNMRHYILEKALSMIRLGMTLSSSIDKKNHKHWDEHYQTCERLIEQAKKLRR